MALSMTRRVRCNTLGTIELTALEDAVLAHPYVQRLRRIGALAFLPLVFPGGAHSRFVHSLGAMHLAGVAWEKLLRNQRRLAETARNEWDFPAQELQGPGGLLHGLLAPTFPLISEVLEDDRTLQALRLAALLHDLGHPPFSHSGERFLPSWEATLAAQRGATAPWLVEHLEREVLACSRRGKDPAQAAPTHEVFTLLLAERVLRDTLAARPDLAGALDPRDVCAVVAPEVGVSPGSPLGRHGTAGLCHELIAGELDVDRMDYLVRDSRECGVVYGIFDADRILDSLALYFDPRDRGLHVAIRFSGLAAFEDFLRARHSMYLQVYFHKTGVACEAMLQHLSRQLGGCRFPAEVERYAALDDHNVGAFLRAEAERLPDPGARARFHSTLDDLLLRRRLWKRVCEVVEIEGGDGTSPVIAEAARFVATLGQPCEVVSSSKSLTRFSPREADEGSRNYLRLIRKDERQVPQVVPIEDYSRIIKENTLVHIQRLYVEDATGPDGRKLVRQVRERLARAPAH